MKGESNLKKELIYEAINEANKNAVNNYKGGGPFGTIVGKDGKVIARGHNTVVLSKYPTAHAEINAIRMAAQIPVTYDLSGCTL